TCSAATPSCWRLTTTTASTRPLPDTATSPRVVPRANRRKLTGRTATYPDTTRTHEPPLPDRMPHQITVQLPTGHRRAAPALPTRTEAVVALIAVSDHPVRLLPPNLDTSMQVAAAVTASFRT